MALLPVAMDSPPEIEMKLKNLKNENLSIRVKKIQLYASLDVQQSSRQNWLLLIKSLKEVFKIFVDFRHIQPVQ